MAEAIAAHSFLGSALILSAELLILVFLCVFSQRAEERRFIPTFVERTLSADKNTSIMAPGEAP